MTDFTVNWLWPQWVFLGWLFLASLGPMANHGKPMLQLTGDEKGHPVRYNAFHVLSRFAVVIAILVCGGFFE